MTKCKVTFQGSQRIHTILSYNKPSVVSCGALRVGRGGRRAATRCRWRLRRFHGEWLTVWNLGSQLDYNPAISFHGEWLTVWSPGCQLSYKSELNFHGEWLSVWSPRSEMGCMLGISFHGKWLNVWSSGSQLGYKPSLSFHGEWLNVWNHGFQLGYNPGLCFHWVLDCLEPWLPARLQPRVQFPRWVIDCLEPWLPAHNPGLSIQGECRTVWSPESQSTTQGLAWGYYNFSLFGHSQRVGIGDHRCNFGTSESYQTIEWMILFWPFSVLNHIVICHPTFGWFK